MKTTANAVQKCNQLRDSEPMTVFTEWFKDLVTICFENVDWLTEFKTQVTSVTEIEEDAAHQLLICPATAQAKKVLDAQINFTQQNATFRDAFLVEAELPLSENYFLSSLSHLYWVSNWMYDIFSGDKQANTQVYGILLDQLSLCSEDLAEGRYLDENTTADLNVINRLSNYRNQINPDYLCIK